MRSQKTRASNDEVSFRCGLERHSSESFKVGVLRVVVVVFKGILCRQNIKTGHLSRRRGPKPRRSSLLTVRIRKLKLPIRSFGLDGVGRWKSDT